jgi:hypothetical protein
MSTSPHFLKDGSESLKLLWSSRQFCKLSSHHGWGRFPGACEGTVPGLRRGGPLQTVTTVLTLSRDLQLGPGYNSRIGEETHSELGPGDSSQGLADLGALGWAGFLSTAAENRRTSMQCADDTAHRGQRPLLVLPAQGLQNHIARVASRHGTSCVLQMQPYCVPSVALCTDVQSPF